MVRQHYTLSSGENNLDNVLVYKKDRVDHILSKTPILLYTGKRNKNLQATNITWQNIGEFC